MDRRGNVPPHVPRRRIGRSRRAGHRGWLVAGDGACRGGRLRRVKMWQGTGLPTGHPNRHRRSGTAGQGTGKQMVETVLFVITALAALTGAVTVVFARNPIYSAVGLLGTLFSVAILYVVQLAHLVAAVQVIVYAGAVMTLFLFVIMLIGVDKEEERVEPLPRRRLWVGGLAGVVILFAAGWLCSGISSGCLPRPHRSIRTPPTGRFRR